MIDEQLVKEYAADTALYYESVHGFVPAQFAKYLRKAVEKGAELAFRAGYEKAKKEIEEELLKCYSGYPEKEAM